MTRFNSLLPDAKLENMRTHEKPACTACGCEWRPDPGCATVSTTLTDEPGERLDIQPGRPLMVIAWLCGRCFSHRKRKALREFVPVSFGRPIIMLTTPNGSSFLEPIEPEKQIITPPTWFEGRTASLAGYVKDPSVLRGYCEHMERLGLRMVSGFSSEADRQAVYHFGLMFGQDFPSIGPPNVFVHPRLVGLTRIAYLVKNLDETEYVGSVSFETWGNNTLVWAWIRPDFRRRRILSHYWPIFESAHAKFRVLAPLSESMKSFLSRHEGHEVTETT